MSSRIILNPNPPEFERFLYATVGEDRQGTDVTVISALSRLGLDPWKEAEDLSTLNRSAASSQLGKLLSGLSDVPSLAMDNRAVAAKLAALLPDRVKPRRRATQEMGNPPSRRIPSVWIIAALVFLVALTWVYLMAHAN